MDSFGYPNENTDYGPKGSRRRDGGLRELDQAADHVVITDLNGRIIYANKAVEINTGFALDEVIGKRPGDLWGGTMGKKFYSQMWHTITVDKRPFVGEVQNRRSDGTLYWQELHISPVLAKNGDLRRFIAIEPNITKRKEREKFRDEFASMVSHQLRNPVQTIALLGEMPLISKTISTEEKENVQAILAETKGLAEFRTNLLTLARAGWQGIRAELADIGSEIEKLVSEVRRKHPSLRISFARVASSSPLVVNKSMTIQVFSNLIHNAVEYAGGAVNISLEKTNSAYIFRCHNDGLVIREEERTEIFSKLFRSAAAHGRKESGGGLGLLIVKMIADSFGWDVWFESATGARVCSHSMSG